MANMKSLDQLVTWATKRGGGRELVRQAVEALAELFRTVLLPDRKLLSLEQQPGLLAGLPPGRDGERALLYWWVEDCIKKRYGQFVEALEELSKDNLEFLKVLALLLLLPPTPRSSCCRLAAAAAPAAPALHPIEANHAPGARSLRPALPCAAVPSSPPPPLLFRFLATRLPTCISTQCHPRTHTHTSPSLHAHPHPHPQEKSMKVMAELLAAKPEAEAKLLSGLVNKLGDPSRQVRRAQGRVPRIHHQDVDAISCSGLREVGRRMSWWGFGSS